MEIWKKRDGYQKTELLDEVETKLEPILENLLAHSISEFEQPFDPIRLRKISKTQSRFVSLSLVTLLLYQLVQSIAELDIRHRIVNNKLHLLVMCKSCKIKESIELSILLNEFVGNQVADMLHFDDKEYVQFSNRLQIEVEPEYLLEDWG